MTPEVIADHLLCDVLFGVGETKTIVVERFHGPVWEAMQKRCGEWDREETIAYTHHGFFLKESDDWIALRINPDSDSRVLEGFLIWPQRLIFALVDEPRDENLYVIPGYLWHSPNIRIIKFQVGEI